MQKNMIIDHTSAVECLQDVISHYNNFKDALELMEKHAVTSPPDQDDKAYWRRELSVLTQMKDQAEKALLAMTPHEAWKSKVIDEGPVLVIDATGHILMHATGMKEVFEHYHRMNKPGVTLRLYQMVGTKPLTYHMAHQEPPDTSRVVILQDYNIFDGTIDKSKVIAVAARYINGNWIGEASGQRIPIEECSHATIWFEAPLKPV